DVVRVDLWQLHLQRDGLAVLENIDERGPRAADALRLLGLDAAAVKLIEVLVVVEEPVALHLRQLTKWITNHVHTNLSAERAPRLARERSSSDPRPPASTNVTTGEASSSGAVGCSRTARRSHASGFLGKARACSRSTRFRTFPEALFGRASTKRM